MFDLLLDEMMEFSSLGIRPGLERTSVLLSRMDDPQKKFKAVQVLGTNGKGSTAAALESIFKAAGMKTALYTSPHLVSMRERLRLNGSPVPIEVWRDAWERVVGAVLGDSALAADRPTFFENLTALCFHIIAEAGVDAAVIEAGMGGRYDATTHCDAAGVVIVPIGMDHMQYLGPTLEAIASEKFAAARRGSVAFYAADNEGLTGQFVERCREAGAEYFLLDRLASPVDVNISLDGTVFSYRPAEVSGLPAMNGLVTPLVGFHQAENAARAATVALKLREANPIFSQIGEEEIRAGLKATDWPGRLEIFRQRGRQTVILDGAHNEHAFRALEATMKSLVDNGSTARIGAIVFAVMKDKDVVPILGRIRAMGAPVYCTQVHIERGMPAKELADMAASNGITVRGAYEDPSAALSAARADAGQNDALLCCGSLYLVGYLRDAFERA
ncbi:MAG: bifunctional folylpolyglutamate synthase/dihydrofolate synthase [Synergistaceae bacterium]|jgi:dihydrofolate synthase/folylpolyglutamate synthase|nr:bifunctional folylpolyglutamate synthase/dihydrofolate synthase [Synergistaceae bacterium]